MLLRLKMSELDIAAVCETVTVAAHSLGYQELKCEQLGGVTLVIIGWDYKLPQNFYNVAS